MTTLDVQPQLALQQLIQGYQVTGTYAPSLYRAGWFHNILGEGDEAFAAYHE